MVRVESEAIDEISYDVERSTLFVRFAHGGWYSYFRRAEASLRGFRRGGFTWPLLSRAHPRSLSFPPRPL